MARFRDDNLSSLEEWLVLHSELVLMVVEEFLGPLVTLFWTAIPSCITGEVVYGQGLLVGMSLAIEGRGPLRE